LHDKYNKIEVDEWEKKQKWCKFEEVPSDSLVILCPS
jgi:hypothetical protein